MYGTIEEAKAAAVEANENARKHGRWSELYVFVFELNGQFDFFRYCEDKYLSTLLPRGAKCHEYARRSDGYNWQPHTRTRRDEMETAGYGWMEDILQAFERGEVSREQAFKDIIEHK